MFEYDLTGKQVILVLDPEILPLLKPCGIDGSPLAARVFEMEEHGLWLETNAFPVCPRDIPKLHSPSGGQFCRAHIFVPAKAVVSLVTFPAEDARLDQDPALHRIGFRPADADRK